MAGTASKKEKPSKRIAPGFYKNNTVEIECPDGVKRRVNKHDAAKLREKFKSAKMQKKFGVAAKA